MENKSDELISWKEKPNTKTEVENLLNPTIKKWFLTRFPNFSLPQLFGVYEIHCRNNILVSAPTGATKTLTGFLSVLNELVDNAEKGKLEDKVYCIYISPLKALSNDIEKNLKEPLKQIEELAGKPLNIRVGVRTGDTTQSDKSKMLRKPPHILITTPESLAIMLSSIKFKDHLKSVDWCIVDEIHALAENKRGTHLSLSLERLQNLAQGMCRVGLSATVSPLEEIAKYLVGENRKCKIIDVQFLKNMDLKVMSPVADLIETTHHDMHHEMYKLIDKLVQEHKTTVIFTNTRAATERVVDHLKNKFPKNYIGNIGTHHGSMSKHARLDIENKLRSGELKCVVCSTSLELGIDIGYIDLVICLGSPKSVARFLQRAGRSGHKLHETVKARIIVLDRDDLVECAVLVKSAIEKKIDRVHIPRLALDVLAQQIIGMSLEQVWDESDLFKTIKKSYCYTDLKRKDFNEILSYLAGEFVDLEDRHIYAKIWREDGKLGKKGRMSRVIYMTNIGTIPDESFITAKVGKETVGLLDENFVERLKPGDVFVLGGETYMFKYTRGMVAQVTASVNRPPTVPRWMSESLPLSFDLANEIGRFRRLMTEQFVAKKKKVEIVKFINDFLYIDDKAATAVFNYFKEQYDYCGEIPSDKKIVIEYCNDGRDQKIVFHSLFGRRVNDCLSRAIAFVLSRTEHKDVELGISDNGFYITGNRKLNIIKAMKMLQADKLSLVMNSAIEKSEVFKRRFRHCATRSFMILRNYMGRQKRVGRQQVSSMILMSALKQLNPDFSILKEAKRECLEDLMDIGNTKKVIEGIESSKIKLVELETKIPSPFGLTLALQGYADVLKIEDKYEFLRRMHEQILAKIEGRETQAVSGTGYVAKARENRNEFKEQLKKDAWNLKHVPKFAKAELIRIIDGERSNIDKRFIEGIEQYKDDIEQNWPDELKKFLFTVLKDLKEGEFSYEDFWNEESEKKEEEVSDEKQRIIEQFNKAARRIKLDAQIKYDVYRMIDGEKDNFRKETKHWLKDLFNKAVPKVWEDDIAKFLQKKMKEIV
ncbi:ATP-dependent helicase [Candidatus Woesearchaeota archaeon CG10_big_fil_rev_8_21_14_0_10_37_12]|nr:MAG: ATP-dependent helicase [Candidatus Woesearchaeota archaeon CG10_big_fil_rev_8_21_14_0_10_37_12]